MYSKNEGIFITGTGTGTGTLSKDTVLVPVLLGSKWYGYGGSGSATLNLGHFDAVSDQYLHCGFESYYNFHLFTQFVSYQYIFKWLISPDLQDLPVMIHFSHRFSWHKDCFTLIVSGLKTTRIQKKTKKSSSYVILPRMFRSNQPPQGRVHWKRCQQ